MLTAEQEAAVTAYVETLPRLTPEQCAAAADVIAESLIAHRLGQARSSLPG